MPRIVFPHPKGPLSGPGTLGGYRISSLFGTRTDPITGQQGTGHGGIDLVMPIGTPVHAVADGTFQPLTPANSGGGGNWAGLLFDDGNYWGTGHCDRFVAANGQHVTAGQLIAYSGNTGKSTGPHGHESFRPAGQWAYADPYDLLVEAQNANRYPGAPATPDQEEDEMTPAQMQELKDYIKTTVTDFLSTRIEQAGTAGQAVTTAERVDLERKLVAPDGQLIAQVARVRDEFGAAQDPKLKAIAVKLGVDGATTWS